MPEEVFAVTEKDSKRENTEAWMEWRRLQCLKRNFEAI